MSKEGVAVAYRVLLVVTRDDRFACCYGGIATITAVPVSRLLPGLTS